MTDLKPCPFCGGPVILGWFGLTPNIHCEKCEFEMDGNYGDKVGTSAIEKWNRRADLPPKVRLLEWQRDSLPNSAPQRHRAEVPGGMGDYSVTGNERKNEWQWFRNGYFVDGHQHHKAMTIEAAKAAAQADHEARILAALVQP